MEESRKPGGAAKERVPAMTVAQFKAAYMAANPSGRFFDPATMKSWGDTMANYGCRPVLVEAYDGPELALLDLVFGTVTPPPYIKAWELFRRRPAKDSMDSAFFTRDTLKLIVNARTVFQERWPPCRGISGAVGVEREQPKQPHGARS